MRMIIIDMGVGGGGMSECVRGRGAELVRESENANFQ